MSNEKVECYMCGNYSTDARGIELGQKIYKLCDGCLRVIANTVVVLIEETHHVRSINKAMELQEKLINKEQGNE